MPPPSSSSPDLRVSTLFSQADKVVLVTGGGTGLGRTVATAFVQNGARKVYISSRKMENLKETADELNALRAGSCVALTSDLTTAQGCRALASELASRERRLDVLVNNSGVSWASAMEDVDERKGWDRVMNVNVKSIFYLTVALLPLLEKDATADRPASVINVSSIYSYLCYPYMPTTPRKAEGAWAYLASKAAASHLTRTLSVPLMRRHVAVNAVAPGFFPTNMTQAGMSAPSSSSSSSSSSLDAFHPSGRAGQARDLASAVLLLASNAHVSGVALAVDGGMSLARLDAPPTRGRYDREWFAPSLEQKRALGVEALERQRARRERAEASGAKL